MLNWQPAIIASRKQVILLHGHDEGEVTQFAGQKIRVRLLPPEMGGSITVARYCPTKELIEVHPEDAERLWPWMFPRDCNRHPVRICTCRVLLD
jgi:hypothetical protein